MILRSSPPPSPRLRRASPPTVNLQSARARGSSRRSLPRRRTAGRSGSAVRSTRPVVAVPNVPLMRMKLPLFTSAVRVDELRCVGDVRRFDAELEPSRPTHGKRPEERHVEVDSPGTTELIAPGVAESDALRLRPCAPGRSRSPTRQFRRCWSTSPTRSAVCWLPGMFTIVAVRRHRERRARECRERSVELPVVDDRAGDVAVSRRCSATAADRRRPRGSCASGRNPPAPCCGRTRSASPTHAGAVVVRHVLGLRQRVGAFDQQSLREGFVDTRPAGSDSASPSRFPCCPGRCCGPVSA